MAAEALISDLSEPFSQRIKEIEDEKAMKLEEQNAELTRLKSEFAKCQKDILADDEFLDRSIVDGNKILYTEGDYDVVVDLKRDRTINVFRLSDFAREQNRSNDFFEIINVKIKDCEEKFGKKLTEAFSDYGDPTVKGMKFQLTSTAKKLKFGRKDDGERIPAE